MWPETDLARFSDSNPVGSGFGDNSFFGSQNNKLNETSGIGNAVSCCKEAVQFSVSIITSLFASLSYETYGTAMSLVFFLWVTLIEFTNTPPD